MKKFFLITLAALLPLLASAQERSTTSSGFGVNLVRGGKVFGLFSGSRAAELAASNSVSGDILNMWSGVYDTTNGVWLKDGVTLNGFGNPLLRNWGTNSSLPNATYGIVLAGNTTVRGLTISNMYHPVKFQVALGANHGHAWSTALTNILLEDLVTYGDSDGFLSRVTNNMALTVRRCRFISKCDTLAFIAHGSSTPTLDLLVEDSSMIITTNSGNFAGGQLHGVGADGYWRGKVIIRNSFIAATNTSSNPSHLGSALVFYNDGGDENSYLNWDVDNSVIIGTNWFRGGDLYNSVITVRNSAIEGATTYGSGGTFNLNVVSNSVQHTPALKVLGAASIGGAATVGSTILSGSTITASNSVQGAQVLTATTGTTGDDPIYYATQVRQATVNATPATAALIVTTADNTYLVEARVVARRTGGASGAAGDSAGYVIRGTYKDIAGTVTLVGSLNADYTAESQAGWDATLAISGTSIQVQVTGAANNNVTWHTTAIVQKLNQ